MIRSGNRAARPLRGRALQMNGAGLWNPIATRKALLICVANQRFTTLAQSKRRSRRFRQSAVALLQLPQITRSEFPELGEFALRFRADEPIVQGAMDPEKQRANALLRELKGVLQVLQTAVVVLAQTRHPRGVIVDFRALGPIADGDRQFGSG